MGQRMTRTLTIEEVRHFIAATNKQFERGGIFVERVRFVRNGKGAVQKIYIDYEQRTEADDEKDDNQSTDSDRY